jgi:hypothetical protein
MTLEHERKRCPKCGHSNRAEAKICTECGYAFFLDDTSGVLRKRCSHCGYMNRMGANVCSQCGSKFHARLRTTRGRSHSPLSARAQVQKWCPQCGAQRREGAKVCSFCGYRFKDIPVTPARKPVIKPVEQSIEPRFEPPVMQSSTQMDALAIQAAPNQPQIEAPFEPPIMQSNTLAEPVTVHNVTSAPPEPKTPDLSGEPAPYITQDELERLRTMGGERPGVFLRLFKAIRDDKP